MSRNAKANFVFFKVIGGGGGGEKRCGRGGGRLHYLQKKEH